LCSFKFISNVPAHNFETNVVLSIGNQDISTKVCCWFYSKMCVC